MGKRKPRHNLRTRRTSERENRFLDVLKMGGSVSAAARSAGIGRQTVYGWRDNDETFANRWDDAIEEGTDRLEDVALKRGVNQSDRLLLAVLRARRPETWGERSFTEHSGSINLDIQHAAETFERRMAQLYGCEDATSVPRLPE